MTHGVSGIVVVVDGVVMSRNAKQYVMAELVADALIVTAAADVNGGAVDDVMVVAT